MRRLLLQLLLPSAGTSDAINRRLHQDKKTSLSMMSLVLVRRRFLRAFVALCTRHGIGPPDSARKLYCVSSSTPDKVVKLLCNDKREYETLFFLCICKVASQSYNPNPKNY